MITMNLLGKKGIVSFHNGFGRFRLSTTTCSKITPTIMQQLPSRDSKKFNDHSTSRIFSTSTALKRRNTNTDKLRIGCASGFWGDTAVAAPQLVKYGRINYLVLDYLSEITMSLLTAVHKKNPAFGYTPDFIQVVVAPLIKILKQKGIRVVTNAGGVNPRACADAIQKIAKSAGVDDLKLGVVVGDDLMPQKESIIAKNIVDIDNGFTMPQEMQSMNAYLGAGPICDALDADSDIVITGRCTDSALILAPLIHEFKWKLTDYDKLAAGSLAGHLIECGAQCTGGNFTDWKSVPNWHNIGFPIAECSDNGDFLITKPPNTGGLVNFGTVAEQLVYEIGDPKAYVLPDVVCDFSNAKITPVPGKENEAVHVTGVKGRPPTNTYKVSGTYASGYRSTAVASVGGGEALSKGKKTADEILKRVRGIFKQLGLQDFTRTHVHTIGNDKWQGSQPPEAVTWIAVQHEQKKALEIFSREIAPAGTGMAPGLSGIVGGRPKVSPVFKLFSFLISKEDLKVEVEVNNEKFKDYVPPVTINDLKDIRQPLLDDTQLPQIESGSFSYALKQLAYTRSGDKGDNCNIGVVARRPEFVPYIRSLLTEEVVEEYFHDVFDESDKKIKKVTRYHLPGINGFNFLLKSSLGGGGIASLRTDPQGKAYGQRLLDITLDNLPDFTDLLDK